MRSALPSSSVVHECKCKALGGLTLQAKRPGGVDESGTWHRV